MYQGGYLLAHVKFEYSVNLRLISVKLRVIYFCYSESSSRLEVSRSVVKTITSQRSILPESREDCSPFPKWTYLDDMIYWSVMINRSWSDGSRSQRMAPSNWGELTWGQSQNLTFWGSREQHQLIYASACWSADLGRHFPYVVVDTLSSHLVRLPLLTMSSHLKRPGASIDWTCAY